MPSPQRSEPPRSGSSEERALPLARFAGIGLQFGAAITLFSLAGYWVDGRLGTRPAFLIVGVLLGFAGGTISMVKSVSTLRRS